MSRAELDWLQLYENIRLLCLQIAPAWLDVDCSLQRVFALAEPPGAPLRKSSLHRLLAIGREQQSVEAGRERQHRCEGRGDHGWLEASGQERLPAEKDAPCLAIARQRNVHIVGKANLSEFAVAPSGFNEYFGTPASPLSSSAKLLPGGSSCGSAVAVASGMADVAFGTDTAGSIRVPAAWCGVVGLKTTHGLVPIEGVFPIEPEHLDTVGPMGKDIAHTVQGMDLLQNGLPALYAAAWRPNLRPKNSDRTLTLTAPTRKSIKRWTRLLRKRVFKSSRSTTRVGRVGARQEGWQCDRRRGLLDQ
jgi:hypothetical protein